MDIPGRKKAERYERVLTEKIYGELKSELSEIEGKLSTKQGDRTVKALTLEDRDRKKLQKIARSESVLGLPKEEKVGLRSRKMHESLRNEYQSKVNKLNSEVTELEKKNNVGLNTEQAQTNLNELISKREDLEDAQNRLDDINRGIELSKMAMEILQKAEPSRIAASGMEFAVDEYKESAKLLMEANDAFLEANNEYEDAKKADDAWRADKKTTAPQVNTAKRKLDTAEDDLKDAKDKASKSLKKVKDTLTVAAEGFNLKKISQEIGRNQRIHDQLEQRAKSTKLSPEQKTQLAIVATNIEQYRSLEQVFLRFGTMLDNPTIELKSHEKEITQEFKKVQSSVRRWGAFSEEVQTMVAAIDEEMANSTIAQEIGKMDKKPVEGKENTESILNTARELEKINETYRNIVGLENFKRDNEESMWLARTLAIVSACSLVLLPVAIIAGICLFIYDLQGQAADNALKTLKTRFGIIENPLGDYFQRDVLTDNEESVRTDRTDFDEKEY